MNPTDNNIPSAGTNEIDASCRVSLLALFGGAALWLVVGLVLGLIGAIKFHAPEFLSACPLMTYGRVAPAANDAILYGFCIPAALGVMLWIFSRLSHAPLALPIVPMDTLETSGRRVSIGPSSASSFRRTVPEHWLNIQPAMMRST